MTKHTPKKPLSRTFAYVLAIALCLLPASTARAADQQLLGPIDRIAKDSLKLLQASNPGGAAESLKQFEPQWSKVEDGVRAKDPDVYARIEVESSRAAAALEAEPPDTARAAEALNGLVSAVRDYGTGTGASAASSGKQGVSALLRLLQQSAAALSAGNEDQASDLLQSFIGLWPQVEGQVKSRSEMAYSQVEAEMTRAAALLLSGPAARGHAADLIAAMTGQLEDVQQKSGYTVWDAGLILLREGMEALLLLAALLAMLRKTESKGGARWVWAGAGAGIISSAVLAAILGLVITAAAGATREGTEGFVGLASVALMVTVGAWLHRRSGLQAWNEFMKKRIGGAIASGSMWGLFLLSFLAVLREGAETVVFYIGIAPAIPLLSLVGGILGAFALLVIIGFLIIRFSVRLPLHYFFLVATVLIYYLAFKIAGQSIHSLQLVGILPTHIATGLPAVNILGMSSTWETFVPQMAILIVILAEVAVTETQRVMKNLRRAATARDNTL
ncbi:MAG: FTR1 family protein [Spirochaetia bacterium]